MQHKGLKQDVGQHEVFLTLSFQKKKKKSQNALQPRLSGPPSSGNACVLQSAPTPPQQKTTLL